MQYFLHDWMQWIPEKAWKKTLLKRRNYFSLKKKYYKNWCIYYNQRKHYNWTVWLQIPYFDFTLYAVTAWNGSPDRSSHRRYSVKSLCSDWDSLLIKLKKRIWHRYFPVNFAKFLRTAPKAASSRRPKYHIFSVMKMEEHGRKH